LSLDLRPSKKLSVCPPQPLADRELLLFFPLLLTTGGTVIRVFDLLSPRSFFPLFLPPKLPTSREVMSPHYFRSLFWLLPLACLSFGKPPRILRSFPPLVVSVRSPLFPGFPPLIRVFLLSSKFFFFLRSDDDRFEPLPEFFFS